MATTCVYGKGGKDGELFVVVVVLVVSMWSNGCGELF